MIKKFVQGDGNGQDLFCLIGGWAISEEVHKALGMPITGRAGDCWQVALNGSTPAGFCQFRLLKSGEIHLRYLYPQEEVAGRELLKSAISLARGKGAKVIFTNDRKTATLWESFGFHSKESNRPGSFVRWERPLL